MKIIVLFIGAFLFTSSIFSQSEQDSIVNYLNHKKQIVSNKNKARFIETLVKKKGLWKATQYHRNGKIYQKGTYKDIKKKHPVGAFINFHKNGKIRSNWSYNEVGKVEGSNKYWFDNEQLDRVGYNKNGKRTGIWKFYHTNGKIALRQYFDNGKLVKTIFYDENEQKINHKVKLVDFQKPKFKGAGLKKFFESLKNFHNKLPFKMNGTVIIDFTINEKGRVTHVNTSDNVSKEIQRELKFYLETIDGWEPAISMNRKVPFHYSIPFKFRTENK